MHATRTCYTHVIHILRWLWVNEYCNKSNNCQHCVVYLSVEMALFWICCCLDMKITCNNINSYSIYTNYVYKSMITVVIKTFWIIWCFVVVYKTLPVWVFFFLLWRQYIFNSSTSQHFVIITNKSSWHWQITKYVIIFIYLFTVLDNIVKLGEGIFSNIVFISNNFAMTRFRLKTK